ncbi:MAG: gamma-glutamyl-gamma-aminobutyrate hydrolase family protein [Anaerolineae bacterium]|nr:gamma-glutamyl-gamma-aminobutyrate hydrolase family protein [Anaerolineae bacterium]
MATQTTRTAPVIGITMGNDLEKADRVALSKLYYQAVLLAGGIPLLLPPLTEKSPLRALYSLCSGLLLTGGGDIASDVYQTSDRSKLSYVDRQRDQAELFLTRWALDERKPLLGICRGIQTLNVAAGGTLIQDIPSEVPSALDHRASSTLPVDQMAHPVTIKPASILAQALFKNSPLSDQLLVNSYHHQAIARVAPGFSVSAQAPDGIIEAIEISEESVFILGVQWHPERMVPQDEHMVQLFRAFIHACQRR